MYSQTFVTPKPIRQEFSHPKEIQVFLVSETMVAAVKQTGHSEITPAFMDSLGKYLSIEDMAHDQALADFFRNHHPFEYLTCGMSFLDYATDCSPTHKAYFNNNVKPLGCAEHYSKKVKEFFGLVGDCDFPDFETEKPYVLHKLKDVILVGVKDVFVKQLSKKENQLAFYIDSLELSAYSLAGAEVRSSRLYEQFVKLLVS